MTDQTAQEPTMEEILASIRRIISEDDAPAETAQAAEPAPEPEDAPVEAAAPEPEPAPEPAAEDDDLLELTEPYEAPAAEIIGDLDVAEPDPFPAPTPAPAPEPVREAPPKPAYDRIVGDSAAASAASAFAGLAAAMRPADPAEPSLGSGLTIDDLARALLRPMLKEWLDAHLPGIVEAEVRKEVERIARAAG
ncbi:MAG: DUF2497 domain-containing protein [Brevundimonas sp.]|jgi:cell pole-organizing protein PopZ